MKLRICTCLECLQTFPATRNKYFCGQYCRESYNAKLEKGGQPDGPTKATNNG
ncbi:hypothetical protein FQZ97_545930 [compost metagenome]